MTPPPLPTSPGANKLTIAAMRAAALLMAVLGLFPFANWLAGGHEDESFAQYRGEWITGSVLVVGGAVVLVILARHLPLWRPGLLSGLVRRAHARPGWTGALLFVGALAAYLVVALWVFAGRPLLIDEIGHVFQARIFAQGRLWLDPPRYPEFFSALHVIDFGGKYYTHFPAGGPLVMLPAVWLGIPWVVGPVFGALSAALFWGLVRRVESRPAVALAASAIFAFSPFVAFLSGSHMNHVPVLTSLLAAMYALARQVSDEATHSGWAALCGFSLGIAATIRPLDAIAFAVPAGCWMLWRSVRVPNRIPELLAAGIAIALPIGALLWYNAHATGHALVFPYEVLWGKSHGLGFHASPWGAPHTPARGVELISIYLARLQTNFFETPVPSLLAPIIALSLTQRVERFDRFLLCTSAAVTGLYFAYWGDGVFLGARFFLVLAPALALWSARLLPAVGERFPSHETLRRGVTYATIVALGVAFVVGIPHRAQVYRHGFISMRTDLQGLAERQGVRNAIIFVREGWGSQLIARMWALGVPRSDTESIYRAVDACALDTALEGLERAAVRDSAALRALQLLTRDSVRLQKGTLTPDRTLRSLPGSTYDAQCSARVMEDRAGFTVATSVLAQPLSSNVIARDLHARDTALVQQYPGRSLYLLRPTSSELGAPLVLEPLRMDSVAVAWQPRDPALAPGNSLPLRP